MLESVLLEFAIQTILISLAVGLVVHWYIQYRKYNFPPGPWRLPLLGNILQLGPDRRFHRQFFKWSKTYGPVITVSLGPLKLVVVNNLETAMEVLVKKSTDFAGRMEWPSIRHLTDGFKDIGFTKYGPTWKLHRRISSKALRQYMQGKALEERIHTVLETTYPVLEGKSEPFNPDDVVDFLVSNIIMGLCFHGKYEYGNKELEYILQQKDEFNRAFNDLILEDVFPPLEYFFTSKPMRTIKKTCKELIDNFIAKKFYAEKKTFQKNNLRHLADTLILAREEAEAEEDDNLHILTDGYLIQTLTDIFFAGIDTTRLTLKFAILHMIAFPDIQKKVQEELDREIGKDRLPGVEDRPNLCYTEAVLHESMRLASVAPSGVFHSTMIDTVLSGYKIPKDTLVMINHWALHNDPDAWVEVEKFKPERYIEENGRLGPKPNNWLPFSAGKRVCLGEFVAKPELHLLFAGLLQKFLWRSEQGGHIDITPQGSLFIGEPPAYKVCVNRRV